MVEWHRGEGQFWYWKTFDSWLQNAEGVNQSWKRSVVACYKNDFVKANVVDCR